MLFGSSRIPLPNHVTSELPVIPPASMPSAEITSYKPIISGVTALVPA